MVHFVNYLLASANTFFVCTQQINRIRSEHTPYVDATSRNDSMKLRFIINSETIKGLLEKIQTSLNAVSQASVYVFPRQNTAMGDSV